ncbi:hypothetical protein FJ366_01920 [Candidatus Dependentiae bacterium]|nr:hypothetical protein [Candidatus Dependentiae bacterium]
MNSSEKSQNIKTSVIELLKSELLCHVPYGILAVAASLFVVCLMLFNVPDVAACAKSANTLFHTLHFIHILFASSSVVLAFRKYSNSFWGSLSLGAIVPAVFCTLSDVFLPYWGSQFFGLNVTLHLCFKHHLTSILPFLIAGIVNGLLLSHKKNCDDLMSSAMVSHFSHSFISALASFLYLLSHGFADLKHGMGIIFIVLLVSVVIPCIISDVIVPIFCANAFDTKACEHDCKH